MLTRSCHGATGIRRGLLFGMMLCSICSFHTAAGQTRTTSYDLLVIRLNSGDKIKGKHVTWRDSVIEMNVYSDASHYQRRSFSYQVIREVCAYKNRATAKGLGVLIGGLACGIGAVTIINEIHGQFDAWDPRPFFGLGGGCAIGGLAGYGAGSLLAGKKRFDVSGNHAVFCQAAEWWKNRYGS